MSRYFNGPSVLKCNKAEASTFASIVGCILSSRAEGDAVEDFWNLIFSKEGKEKVLGIMIKGDLIIVGHSDTEVEVFKFNFLRDKSNDWDHSVEITSAGLFS